MNLPSELKSRSIDNATFLFDVVLGRVMAAEKWSETQVWGQGGGGHVGRNGGYVSPVNIQSSVDTYQNVWIEREDGTPYCLQTRNMNIQALEGHPLTAILVRHAGGGNDQVGLVGNLATGIRVDDSALCAGLIRAHTSSFSGLAYRLLAFALAGGTMWAGKWLLGLVILFPALAAANWMAKNEKDDAITALRRHLSKVDDWVVGELRDRHAAAHAVIVDALQNPAPATPDRI